MLGRSISKNSLILAIFALVTAGLLALIFGLTEGKIKVQQQKAAEKALLEIIPRERHDNAMLETAWAIPTPLLEELGLKESASIHVALKENSAVAVIIPATAPDGYSGDIHMLVGIDINGIVAGVRILSHKETPGLGDKVDLNKSDWVLSFNERSLRNPIKARWKVKKDGGDFDQFTGATITPRAVVKQVKHVLEFFQAHQDAIFSEYLIEASHD